MVTSTQLGCGWMRADHPHTFGDALKRATLIGSMSTADPAGSNSTVRKTGHWQRVDPVQSLANLAIPRAGRKVHATSSVRSFFAISVMHGKLSASQR